MNKILLGIYPVKFPHRASSYISPDVLYDETNNFVLIDKLFRMSVYVSPSHKLGLSISRYERNA